MVEHIDLHLGIACTLNEWIFLLRSRYEAMLPFHSPTGRQTTVWCCPYTGRKLDMLKAGELKASNKPAGSTCDSCVDGSNIPPDDLELWEFCPSIFAHHLCASLGLHADPKLLGEEILHLGSLVFRSSRLPAFLLKKSDVGYQLHAQSLVANHSECCLFFTPRYCPDTAEWLEQVQHGYFPLEDLLLPGSFEPSPVYWQVLQDFKSSLVPTPCQPDPEIFIAPDFRRISFPDGYVINLTKAHKRRAVVRFIHEQVGLSGKDEFDVEVMREAYNNQYSAKPWNSDRFKEDLFKGTPEDFDRIFETIDAPLGKYRLKL